MRAIVVTRTGPPEVLELREVEKPTPKDHEVLIKVHAGTVTAGDVVMRKLPPLLALPMQLFGFKTKTIPGHEFAGEIEVTGKDVTRFRTGERVFGTTTGLNTGANAEYVCVPEEWGKGVIAQMPNNVSYAEAAAVPVGGMTALYLLKEAGIRSGQQVLVYGASGSVGTFGVQIAKSFGATVTGVASTKNVALVESLGADRVIDYTQRDWTKSGERYDLIFDGVGKMPDEAKRNLKENGVFVSIRSSTHESASALLFLKDLVEQGKLKPVIDQRYPLEQTAEAHRYVEQGHKRGNVVILVR